MPEEKKPTQKAEEGFPPGFTLRTFPDEYRSVRAAPTRSLKIPILIAGGVVVLGVGVFLFFSLSSPKLQTTPPSTVTTTQPETTTPPSVPPETPPENIPETPPETPPTTPVDVILSQSADADQDGLTDREEVLYRSDPQKPDTDEDGFLDGHEVFHLYNPSGREPEKLEDAGLVARYTNPTFRYSVLYPNAWTVKSLDATNREVMFQSDTSEFIQAIIQENPQQLTPEKWYLGVNPDADIQSLKSVTTKGGLSGVESTDGLSVYLGFVDENQQWWIISLTSAIGTKPEIHFRMTWQMMVNSFRVQ